MSKVISFSISDRYLDKLRSLYPSLTDNLAAKQFLTDRLDSSLGNSLDASLDDSLDGKLKSLIESELDGLLDERLDAVMGKSLTSLSERLSRLEERLDTNLDGGLDEMELLLRMQREASITSLIPTGEPSPSEPVQPAIETVTPEVSPSPPGTDAIEDSEKKIIPLPDTLIGSPIGIDESGSEPGTDAIGTVGMTAMAAAKYLKAKKVVVSYDSLHRWISREKIPDTSPQGKDALKHLILRGKLYFPKTDQP
jgi:hypothetical protein